MNALRLSYTGSPVDLARLELPTGGWVDVDATWVAGDNTQVAFTEVTTSDASITVERLSDRRWRLHSPAGTHRLAIFGTLDEGTFHVADLVIAGRRRQR